MLKLPSRLFLLTLSVCLGGIVALVDDEVFGLVVLAAREVGVEDGFGAGSVSLQESVREGSWVGYADHTFWASIEVPDIWGTIALPPPHGFWA